MLQTVIAVWAVAATLAGAQDSSQELSLIAARRKTDLGSTAASGDRLSSWLAQQQADGTWPDVNYVSGCDAQRANWPIQEHWNRVISFAAAYGGYANTNNASSSNDSRYLGGALKGLDYWFKNDYTSDDCIGSGGLSNGTCPCGTPGLWNTNWFDQVILVPQLCSTACLLLEEHLSTEQLAACIRIPSRAYDRRDDFIHGLGYLTGANTINVMQNSISLGLYAQNTSIVQDAYARAMAVVVFSDKATADGIHRDGSFLQHNGILYNGNYGKDLMNAFIQLEGEARGTSFSADASSRQAYSTVIQGSEWLTYTSNTSKQIHWDFNAIGRFIAFPVADLQASADLNINVTKLAAATSDFEGSDSLSKVVTRWQANGTAVNSNSGPLEGNKMFFASDVMVNRRSSFIQTSKAISRRSRNTECTNSANPYGYHMLDTLFTYVSGDEYQDVQAAWNWNLIPGTTSILNSPKLACNTTQVQGNASFVGGASDGWVGTQALEFVDPISSALRFRKVRHFFDDGVLTTISNVEAGNSTQPVISVLDQRRLDGTVLINGLDWRAGQPMPSFINSVWHGGSGFLAYDQPFALNITAGNRTGNWSSISTSTAGLSSVPIFSAYTSLPGNLQSSGFSYATYPAVDAAGFGAISTSPTMKPLDLGTDISAATAPSRLSLVFWAANQTALVPLSYLRPEAGRADTLSISVDAACIVLITRQTEGDIQPENVYVTIADPTQSLEQIRVDLQVSRPGSKRWHARAVTSSAAFEAVLPRGGHAGDSIQTIVRL